jgi:hypothetical protein
MLNKNQEALNDYLNDGNKLIQKNNRLWMNGEVLNTKTLTSLMFKLYGSNYTNKIRENVVIED